MRRGLRKAKKGTFEIQIRRSGLSRAKVDALGSKVGGAGFLGCAAENLGPPRDLEIDEPGVLYQGLELCFQQSAGDSTSPQVDDLFGFLGNGYVYQDVPYLEASSGFEDAMHLSQGGRLVWDQIEHSIGDNHFRPFVGHG